MNRDKVHYVLGLVLYMLDDIYRSSFFANTDNVSFSEFNSARDFLRRCYTITDEVPF
jgi:hypothetical protein